MSKIVAIASKKDSERKTDLLDILEEIKKGIEDGSVNEMVTITLDKDGDSQLSAVVDDNVGAIGMFELGKVMFFQQISKG